MNKPIPQLLTTGRIALLLGVPKHRIKHVLETRPDISPTALAGRTRLYSRQAMARIRHELNAIDANRSGGDEQ